jgi:hypothetical protein
MTGFRGLLYSNSGHFLDGAPLEAVNTLSRIPGDAEHVRMHSWVNDFAHYSGPNTAGEAGGWLLTETAAGGTNRVDVDDDAPYGILRLSTGTTDDNSEILQMRGEPWKYVVGKKL